MKMKKHTFFALMILLSLTLAPTQQTFAKNIDPITNTTSTKEAPADVKVLMDRLDEIKAIDKSSLNHAERKALRKEVRSINSSLHGRGGGVYLSIGAVILIALLLIILL